MEMAVIGYDGRRLEVRAPLPPNRNLHGTAFAGSLFSICVLTGWGATWLALRARDLDGQIVVADSAIRYRRAITTDLICSCETDPTAVTASLDELAGKGRASLALRCSLDSAGRPAVSFEATYVVLAPAHR